MSVRIPLRILSFENTPETQSRQGGLRLNLPLRIGGQVRQSSIVPPAQQRQEHVLLAVAAAVSLSNPGQALQHVKLATDDPQKIAVAHEQTKEDLAILLDSVGELVDDRSNPPDIQQSHQTVAQAIGADPVLVSRAHSVVEADPAALAAGIKWVATIDIVLLERAARAGARVNGLELVPSQLNRLQRLDSDVKTISSRFQTIDGKFEKIDDQFQTIGSQFGEIDGQFQEINNTVQTIDTRVKKIESQVGDDPSKKQEASKKSRS